VAVLAERLDVLRRRIAAAGGDPAVVRVVAVTKTLPATAVRAACAVGLDDMGENYAQELTAKAADLGAGPPVRWHFLGHIQRNKVPKLAPLVSCWQGVTRIEEGAAIARHRPGAAVLVEMNATDLPGRNGCRPEKVAGLVEDLGQLDLSVDGLMTVAPAQPAAAERAFSTLRRLADELGLPVRSMGMTDDLEAAVAHGSTMVRIGRGLFGDRVSTTSPPARGARPRW
jgi:pyridoxal phosphate enzyme (YggS family)